MTFVVDEMYCVPFHFQSLTTLVNGTKSIFLPVLFSTHKFSGNRNRTRGSAWKQNWILDAIRSISFVHTPYILYVVKNKISSSVNVNNNMWNGLLV